MIKTCSKESGQRLVEFGVKTDSRFYHWYDDLLDSKTHNTDGCTPAWTACELGEMLPNSTILIYDAFSACYPDYGLSECYAVFLLKNPDAICNLIFWLLENGHITKEEVNA